MTTAMHDNRAAYDHDPEQPRPTSLRKGALVYLWAPGEQSGLDRPLLAKVERSSVDTIVAVDLDPHPVPGQHPVRRVVEVGSAFPPALRWTWELAAQPQLPPAFDEVEIVAAQDSISERTQLLAGEPGNKLRVTLINGEVVHGVLTRLFMGQDSWQAEWGELVDHAPGRDTTIHAVRIEHVSKISRSESV